MLNLYNTLTRKKEEFKPISGKDVGLYTCGPTVYNYAHIGNLRTYVFEDILRRVLKYNGYKINHVMNITDVGHLTDDADQGEDKMEKGSKREGKTAWEIADFYTDAFKENLKDLNILEPNIWTKATDHIDEQIDMVSILLEKGFGYETTDGIYFDTTKLDDYGKLAQLDKQELKAGARIEMGEKKNPHDFALWKFTKAGETRQMEWATPFGSSPFGMSSSRMQGKSGRKGFPGWHIECSAMSMKYLGDHFDIHAGGVDHVPVHHTNEIAQSEAITDKKPWVNYWLHGEFLVESPSAILEHNASAGAQHKMSKSDENFITLDTLKEKGLSPLAYRYFLLQAHYKKQLQFSWEAVEAAEQGLKRLRNKVNELEERQAGDPKVAKAFLEAINDDLNTPEALAIVSKGLKEKTINLEMITEFDKVLGLNLRDYKEKKVVIPNEVQELLDKRLTAREEKNWEESDRLRDEISSLGFSVQDGPASGGKVEDSDEGQEVLKP